MNVPVTGVGAGSATITASTPNFGNATANATVSATLSGIILPGNMTVPPGQSAPFPVTLGTAAPAGGVFITLTSSDPSKATIAPENIFIPQNASTPNRAPTVTGASIGSATISAAASGFPPASGQVQVTSGGPANTINLPASTTVGLAQSVSLAVTLPAPAPTGGVNVLLASSDTSKVSVTPSVFIAGGATSPATQAQVTGINAGLVNISASAPGYAPGSGQVQAVAGGGGGSSYFLPGSLTVTVGVTQNVMLNLSGPAPAGGLTASLSSTNTGVVTVPVTVTFGPGATIVNVPLTGVAPGSATIAASIPNFGNATTTVTVSPISQISMTWHGACLVTTTLYGITGQFQAIDYLLITPAPVTLQGSLFFAPNCPARQGFDNMNDFGSLTNSGHSVQGFSHYPDTFPTSAVYWIGPRTADGMCAPGSPCSGCVNYVKTTPDCSTLP